jgi:hypothetical protein
MSLRRGTSWTSGETNLAPKGPEVDALLRDFKARHYATRPDDHLPAFDGLTPRQSSKQPKYRARVDTLIKDMGYHESPEAPDRRFDFGAIRRILEWGWRRLAQAKRAPKESSLY